MLPSLRWRNSNPRSRMATDLQFALVAAGEHLIIFLWNLVESNHVIWIFSPAHTPSLPKFLWRRLRDSNPWGVLPPSGFQDQCNRPTLPNLQFAEAEGFALDLWSLCSQRTSETFRFYTFLVWQAPPSSPSEQRVALPLSHTSIGFRVQRYYTPMQPFCVTQIIFKKSLIMDYFPLVRSSISCRL